MTDVAKLREVLLAIVSGLPDPDPSLIDQARNASPSADGPVTMIDIDVPGELRPTRFPNGPLPIRTLVKTPQDQLDGELLVWVKDGYIDCLEFAWWSNEAPTALPSESMLQFIGHSADGQPLSSS